MTAQQAYLIGDIGATNVRFHILEPGTYRQLHQWRGKVADYPGPLEAIDATLASLDTNVRLLAAVFGIAAPVEGDYVRMINHPWAFSQSALRQHFDWQTLRVVNDFEAAARGVLALAPEEIVPVGTHRSLMRDLPQVVLGPGTGLGVAGLIPVDGRWQVLSTEGGHVRFAPATREELELLRALREESECVQREDLLSGPGLCNIYYGLAEVQGKLVRTINNPEEITRQALEDGESFCAEVLTLFCGMLGSAAADIALNLGARGGLFLAGGILPGMSDFFLASPFRQRFEDHPRMREYLQTINVSLVTHKDIGLLGMAQLLRETAAVDAEAEAHGSGY